MTETVEMVCPKCGGKAFRFKWKWENQDEYNRLMLCHDGFGLQYEDAIITCSSCEAQNEEWDIK